MQESVLIIIIGAAVFAFGLTVIFLIWMYLRKHPTTGKNNGRRKAARHNNNNNNNLFIIPTTTIQLNPHNNNNYDYSGGDYDISSTAHHQHSDACDFDGDGGFDCAEV